MWGDLLFLCHGVLLPQQPGGGAAARGGPASDAALPKSTEKSRFCEPINIGVSLRRSIAAAESRRDTGERR
jgi:hypothetical protein